MAVNIFRGDRWRLSRERWQIILFVLVRLVLPWMTNMRNDSNWCRAVTAAVEAHPTLMMPTSTSRHRSTQEVVVVTATASDATTYNPSTAPTTTTSLLFDNKPTSSIITATTCATTTTTNNNNHVSALNIIPIVLGIDGGTESIRAAFFNAHTGHIIGSSSSSFCAYETYRPHPGWAEQHPDEWYSALCVAVRKALENIDGVIISNEEAEELMKTAVAVADPDTNTSEGDIIVNDNITNDDRNKQFKAVNDDADDSNKGVRRNNQSPPKKYYSLQSLCIDTTCCSVVALSSAYTPLRPCLLWMDARSASEAKQIMDVVEKEVAAVATSTNKTCTTLSLFPELRINSAGHGPISAEFLLPKSMWIKKNEPRVWEQAAVICEYQDYMNYRLTGNMVASGCNAAVRWHHDGWEVVQPMTKKEEEEMKADSVNGGRNIQLSSDSQRGEGDSYGDANTFKGEEERHRGRPMRLYKILDMEDLARKLPPKTLSMGDIVGGLTSMAARDLGLPVGTKVVQGGADAFVGMIGLGVVRPGQTCLITGSSHLHCLVTSKSDSSSRGTWGAYRGAPLSHLSFIEGGQSSTGSLIRWARDITCPRKERGGGELYKVLDEEASAISAGCDGLVALETWQGSRTPHTDPLARGALLGLTLSHTRAHVYRALLEAVCYGTRSCLDALEEAASSSSSIDSHEVVIAGGVTRSDLWLQLHADITGRTFLLNENADGPLLGCAILASVGAGVYGSVEDAVQNMVRSQRRIEPRPDLKKKYDELYREVYMKVRPSVTSVFHALANLRGGDNRELGGSRKKFVLPRGVGKRNVEHLSIRGGSSANNDSEVHGIIAGGERKPIIISPSLLASDWSDIKGEVQKCLDAGVPWLHVDMFDGVFLDSPHALTFGPFMVDSIRKRFSDRAELILDVHLCVERPERYVRPLANVGATRIIFQWEAMGNAIDVAITLIQDITLMGMKCGISINPETDVSVIYPLLDTGMVDIVDILAVEPGFGGQQFNHGVIPKIEILRRYREKTGLDFNILVDGGINGETSSFAVDAGADILVAGSALFKNTRGFKDAIQELL